jgi:curli biogenesis system outer membrane secretion channel CsgG
MLFGILGSAKKQTAYAKVSLNIVDVLTSQIVYSTLKIITLLQMCFKNGF